MNCSLLFFKLVNCNSRKQNTYSVIIFKMPRWTNIHLSAIEFCIKR